MPHTAAIAACTDPSVLGRTFYLMGFVDGWSPMRHRRAAWPAPFDERPRRPRGSRLPARRGHRPARATSTGRPRASQDLGRPDGFHDRQVDRWTSFLERIKGRELPGLDVAAGWLRAHRPIDYVPGLMHGDYQFANVMFEHGAPAQLAAIVDWEMGTVGDPKLDLGWVVQGWPDDPKPPRGGRSSYVDMYGMPTKDQVVEHYAEVSGRQVDDIDYYVDPRQVEARHRARAGLPAGRRRREAAGVRADRPRADAGRGRPRRDDRLSRMSATPDVRVPPSAATTAPPEVVDGRATRRRPRLGAGPGASASAKPASVNFPDVLLVANQYQLKVAAAVRARQRARRRGHRGRPTT